MTKHRLLKTCILKEKGNGNESLLWFSLANENVTHTEFRQFLHFELCSLISLASGNVTSECVLIDGDVAKSHNKQSMFVGFDLQKHAP